MCISVLCLSAQMVWDGTAEFHYRGEGTQSNPYLISTAEELAGFAKLVSEGETFEGKYLKLDEDIILNSEDTPEEEKREWLMIGYYDGYGKVTRAFSGHFDGGGHTIYGVYMGRITSGNTVSEWGEDVEVSYSGGDNGFFGCLENATVENITFHKMTMRGGGNVGGFCNGNLNSTIRNVHITDSEIATSTSEVVASCGGLVAWNYGGLIENCSVDARMRAYTMCGGLVAHNDTAGIIRDCIVSGYAYARQSVGGFVADNYGLIERCSTSADVRRGAHYTGINGTLTCAGFVHRNLGGVIRDSYATGDVVKSMFSAAGFCGTNRVSTDGKGKIGVLENCYYTGDVEVIYDRTSHSFVKANENGSKIINCFSTAKVTAYDSFDNDKVYEGVGGFLASSDIDKSLVANCYFDSEKNLKVNMKKVGELAVTTDYMKSKEFVDTLNMMSALLGLSKWQYNAEGYPTLTTEKATNVTDYLAGGSGTKEDPWRVETIEHLKNIAAYTNHGYNFRGNYILQTADITVNPSSATQEDEAFEQWEPIGKTVTAKEWNGGNDVSTMYNEGRFSYLFCGTYDGGLHEVRNIYCYDPKHSVGFFGNLHDGAQIRNLGVTDVYMRSGDVSGILAAIVSGSAEHVISQCWTSGSIGTLNGQGTFGFIGAPTDRTFFYNCYSTADMSGNGYTRLLAGFSGYAQKQAVNYLYYGKLSDLGSRIDKAIATANYYINLDSITTQKHSLQERWNSNTEEMQSKELLNRMNYFVAEYNATHPDEPLLWWKHNEGDYPTFTAEVPEHTITYVTNGVVDVVAQNVYDNSKMFSPDVKGNETVKFAGWYIDEALTKAFNSDGLIVSDTTLYAKWIDSSYEQDYTPFADTEANVITISTPAQLYAFASILNGTSSEVAATTFEGKTIQLGADILLNDTAAWEEYGKTAYGTQWLPIGTSSTPFQGTFDGRGYTVSGMFMQVTDANEHNRTAGLFAVVGEKATIRNLNIKASCLSGYCYSVGLLAGINKGAIDNCSVEGNILPYHRVEYYSGGFDAGSENGLLVGSNNDAYGNITNCHARGSILGNNRYDIGGLVGSFKGATSISMRNCSADVNIQITRMDASSWYEASEMGGLVGYSTAPIVLSHAKGTISGYSYLGGIVGRTYGNIDSCYAEVDVQGIGEHIGGLGGDCQNINHSYAKGNVTGNRYVGGLAGTYPGSKEIKNGYHIGDVVAADVYAGGIVGHPGSYLTVANCYQVGNVSGTDYVDGLAYRATRAGSYYDITRTGWEPGDANGKTTEEMQSVSNYVDWDFSNMWSIAPDYNGGYPYLRSFAPEKYKNYAVFVLSNDSLNMTVGEEVQLTASVFHPEYTTVEWRSGDTSILTVVEGKVTAIHEGETDVEILTPDGQKAVCHVKVEMTTGIDSVEDDRTSLTTPRKVMENGRLYIIRHNVQTGNMEKYSATGVRVE